MTGLARRSSLSRRSATAMDWPLEVSYPAAIDLVASKRDRLDAWPLAEVSYPEA